MPLGDIIRFQEVIKRPRFRYQPLDDDLSKDPLMYRPKQSNQHGGHRSVTKERQAVKIFVLRLLKEKKHSWNEMYPHEQEQLVEALRRSFPSARFFHMEAVNIFRVFLRKSKKGMKIKNYTKMHDPSIEEEAYEEDEVITSQVSSINNEVREPRPMRLKRHLGGLMGYNNYHLYLESPCEEIIDTTPTYEGCGK